MSGLTEIIYDAAERRLRGGRCTIDDILAAAYDEHGDIFREESERLVWMAARRVAKEILRRMSEDDDGEEMSLPGLSLPSAIAVRDAETGEVVYVDTHVATWDDLLAGQEERERNVAAAQAKLDTYRANLRRLRPLMEGTALTVEAALRSERAA